jgi:class 3 adenylate cyclase/tetratricopeptide (TPR) repeat protein
MTGPGATGGASEAAGSHGSATVDGLLDRAVAAVNRGDVAAARELAGAVLASDTANRDAAALLAEPPSGGGELRRASLLFVDLVGSTELSERHDPEQYRGVVRRYTTLCRDVIEARYGGHISHIAGDGVLAVFGLPTPHENDAERAVRAALDIAAGLASLSAEVDRVVGQRLDVRAAVHKGLVYLDTDGDEVYGLAANVAARLHGLAAPGTVLVSEDVLEIVGDLFDTAAEPAQHVKGVTEPLRPYRVLAPRREAASRGRRWAGPLVGRVTERAALEEAWQEVAGTTGNGRAAAGWGGERGPCGVHVVGEPGIGKSRLCASFLDDVAAGVGARVELLGSPLQPDASLHPVRALIDARLDEAADGAPGAPDPSERLATELARLGLDPDEVVPLLAPVTGIGAGTRFAAPAVEGDKLRAAIVDAAFRYVDGCLRPGPAVLVVEDVHWCDEATLEVVGRVLGGGRTDVLVITTSRDPAPPPLRSSRTIALEPLDPDAATELVRSLQPTLDADSCARLVARADGMPLYLEELAHGAVRPAAASRRAPAAAVPREGPPPGARAMSAPVGIVPDALYEPLVSRLHVTPAAVPVAGAAATIGRDLDRRLLARVAGVPEPELEDALAGLLDGRVLERAPGAGRYRFRHELLRDVAYELLPTSQRRHMHARVAEALAADGTDGAVDWRLVAAHYDLAGRPEAVPAYQQAADGAQRLGALAEARSLLDRAVEVASELPESTEQRRREVGLRLRRGFLAVSAQGNRAPDAVRDYERCLELALADPASDEMFSTLISLYGYYVIRGDLARAEQVAEMLRSLLGEGHDDYAADNMASFGVLRWYSGDFAEARRLLENAISSHAAQGSGGHYAGTWFMPSDGRVGAHAFLALARAVRGDGDGADEQVAAGLARCRDLPFPHGPYSAAEMRAYEVWIEAERDDVTAARAAIDEMRMLADRHGFQIWEPVAALEGATVDGLEDLRTGADPASLAARVAALDGWIAVWQALDLAVFMPFYLAVSARLHGAAGDVGRAVARIDEALAFSRTTGMRFYDAELLRIRAGWSEEVGADRDDALVAARELARTQGATLFEQRIDGDLRGPAPS